MKLHFTKMHGLGNDFMVVDRIRHPVRLSRRQIQRLADRHFGVGFDQLLMIDPPDRPDVDFHYRIFNADGGEVEHCGNGARCFARYVLDKGLIASRTIRVSTVNRLLTLKVSRSGLVSVDMGEPDFDPAALPFHAGHESTEYPLEVESAQGTETIRIAAVSVGNPHCVLTVADVDTAPVHETGPRAGAHQDFPQGVNVGFMQVVDRSTIRLRVYERGAGETVACGTGACAAVVCGIRNGQLDHTVTVQLRGGELSVEWPGPGHPITMTGPATTVFEGTLLL
ncbi:MAG: diaminopimelate epimerase [Pseudohongiellaceae bacterium]